MEITVLVSVYFGFIVDYPPTCVNSDREEWLLGWRACAPDASAAKCKVSEAVRVERWRKLPDTLLGSNCDLFYHVSLIAAVFMLSPA